MLYEEAELIKSIKESQEKLKMAQKLEKTTDLVDDIIKKVGVLQTEMRKKSSAMKLKEDIEKYNKEQQEKRHLEELKRSLTSLSLRESDSDHHHHHHHVCHHTHRSRSREVRIHDCCSRSRSRSVSCPSRSVSRERKLTSILKPTSSKTYPTESKSTIFTLTSRSRSRSRPRSDSSSLLPLRQSFKSVKPKVKSWNVNCKHHDENIY